jgi:hypothetical protein
MANPGTLPITLVTILLLVAPGYVAIRLFLRYSERKQPLDRTEKVVWSSAASLLSLFIVYATSPLHFGLVTDVGRFLLNAVGVVSGSRILGLALPTGVLLYLLHLVVLFLGAFSVAETDRRRRDDPYGQRRPWYYAFNDLGEEEIEVVLQDGSRISGQFVPAAWDPSIKDLFLENPTRLEGRTSEPLGRSILIRSENISAVAFVEEAPQNETVDAETSETIAEKVDKMRELVEGDQTKTESERTTEAKSDDTE